MLVEFQMLDINENETFMPSVIKYNVIKYNEYLLCI